MTSEKEAILDASKKVLLLVGEYACLVSIFTLAVIGLCFTGLAGCIKWLGDYLIYDLKGKGDGIINSSAKELIMSAVGIDEGSDEKLVREDPSDVDDAGQVSHVKQDMVSEHRSSDIDGVLNRESTSSGDNPVGEHSESDQSDSEEPDEKEMSRSESRESGEDVEKST